MQPFSLHHGFILQFDRDGSDEGKLNKKWFSMPDLDEKKKRAMEREEEEAREAFGNSMELRMLSLHG